MTGKLLQARPAAEYTAYDARTAWVKEHFNFLPVPGTGVRVIYPATEGAPVMPVLNSDKTVEPLVTAEEAAKYLGFAASTIRKLARFGSIPAIGLPRAGGYTIWRFKLSDLEEYVDHLGQRVRENHG